MVHADAASEQALEDFAEGRREARALGRLLDGLALLLVGNAKLASDCAVASAASWLKCTI